MHDLLRDLRFATRSLARAPGFTAVALLTLALGIGANAAMFGVVDGVVLRPLPYPRADQLARVYQASPEHGVADGRISPLDLADWRQRARGIEALAGYLVTTGILRTGSEPVELEYALVTEGFFDVLASPMHMGRPLQPQDARQASRTAVVSHRLWATRLGGDAGVVGNAIRFAGESFTVVGVAARGVHYPTPDTELWVPQALLGEDEVGPNVRDNRYLEGVARLAEGVALDAARGELAAVAAQLAAEHPATNGEWGAVTVLPLLEVLVGDVDRALGVVLGAVGFILLIGCANLANLLLARGSRRGREIAIRTALGARRGRIVRQLLTESVLLALAGAVLGLALAAACVQALPALAGDILPRVEGVRVDGRVVGFGVALALLTAVLFGLLPALRAVRPAPHDALRGGRGAVGSAGQRTRRVLVVAEVALAVVLVVGAGLMARSFLALRGVDPGFRPDGALLVRIDLDLEGIPAEGVPGHILRRRAELIAAVQALPGVVVAGTANTLPLQGTTETFEFHRADRPEAADRPPLRAGMHFASPGYLSAMGVPLLRGEPLPEEVAGLPVPMLISESAARRFWPGEEALGKRARVPWGETVVAGIVGDVRQLGLAEEPPPTVYFPQAVGPRRATTLVARTSGDPTALLAPVRRAIREVDPRQPIRDLTTLGGVVAESVARDRFFTLLFALFGSLALGLAALGIYGVLAYSVGQRTQEIGVRMALGARPSEVLRQEVGAGMALVGAGIALGAGAALLLTRLLESQLYGVAATDPLSFAAALAALVAVGLLASLLPARRATRVAPLMALRAGE